MLDFWMDLQLFSEGDEGGDGDSNNANDGDQQSNESAITFPDEKSFMARVGREAKKQLESQAKEMGFESVEAMQAALKAAKDADEQKKSDLEKEKEARAKAERDAATAKERANQTLIRAEFKILAKEAGAVNPDSAFKLADLAEVAVDDDGNVTGVDEAVKALQKSDPYLFGKAQGGPVGNPSNPGGGNPAPEESLGLQLGKARAEQAKKQSETRNHYFK